jgi:hypothetical protein
MELLLTLLKLPAPQSEKPARGGTWLAAAGHLLKAKSSLNTDVLAFALGTARQMISGAASATKYLRVN